MTDLRYIHVDEDVYRAALDLQKKADTLGIPSQWLAERELHQCNQNGNNTDAKFWKSVWHFEMTLNCVSAGTLILINTNKT